MQLRKNNKMNLNHWTFDGKGRSRNRRKGGGVDFIIKVDIE